MTFVTCCATGPGGFISWIESVLVRHLQLLWPIMTVSYRAVYFRQLCSIIQGERCSPAASPIKEVIELPVRQEYSQQDSPPNRLCLMCWVTDDVIH